VPLVRPACAEQSGGLLLLMAHARQGSPEFVRWVHLRGGIGYNFGDLRASEPECEMVNALLQIHGWPVGWMIRLRLV